MRHKKEITLNKTKVYLYERSVVDIRYMEITFPDAVDDKGLIKNEYLYEYMLASLKLSLKHNYDDFEINVFNKSIIIMNPFKYFKIKKAINVKTLVKLTIKELLELYCELRILEMGIINNNSETDKKKAVTE